MDLFNDPMKAGGVSVGLAAGSAYFLGLTHLVTLGVVAVGGLLVLRALLKK
jgi:hypothetical protein